MPTQEKTANEIYIGLVLRHQINLRAFTAREVRLLLELMERSDKELVAKLRDRLPNITGADFPFLSKHWKALLDDIRRTRKALIEQVAEQSDESLRAVIPVEQSAEISALATAMPIEVAWSTVPIQTLRAAVLSQPFAGGPNAANTLAGWFKSLQQVDQARLVDAIRLGVAQGETIDDIVRRVAGTKSQNYTDGVLSLTRRQAEAVVRTGVNHVTNAARQMVWDENSSVIAGIRWVSTLDGRTSAICRARDGKVAPLGSKPQPKGTEPLIPNSARPPAHINCRSTTAVFFDNEGIEALVGDRPFVRSGKTRKAQERTFRDEAREKFGERWKTMSAGERAAETKAIKSKWVSDNVGRVSSRTTYDEWLRTQPTSFQDSVLGKGKADLFRKGLKLDQFVDMKGRELTLDQLRELDNKE